MAVGTDVPTSSRPDPGRRNRTDRTTPRTTSVALVHPRTEIDPPFGMTKGRSQVSGLFLSPY